MLKKNSDMSISVSNVVAGKWDTQLERLKNTTLMVICFLKCIKEISSCYTYVVEVDFSMAITFISLGSPSCSLPAWITVF